MKNATLCRILIWAVVLAGCEASEEVVKGPYVEAAPEEPALPPEVDSEEQSGYSLPFNIPPEYREKVEELYKKAIESGEKVPDSVTEWVKQDINAIGDWEYRILDTAEVDAEKLTEELNKIGDERWECFWVEETEGGKRFYFKKAKWSYMRNAGGLVRFIPIPTGGGAGN